MMDLPKLENLQVEGKKIIVRADLDIEIKNEELFRLQALLPTLKYLLEKNTKILLIGHKGRPNGVSNLALSLKGIVEILKDLLPSSDIGFIEYAPLSEFAKIKKDFDAGRSKITLLENLRFWPEEESNDFNFSQKLASLGDYFINEAFAVSHRKHASIVGIPQFLKGAFGFRFCEEVENLSRVFENPEKPVIAIISGLKEDKLSYINGLLKFCDQVLIAGRLPDYIDDENELRTNKDVLIADLNPDKEDITIHSIENFEKEIEKAKTILLSGPIGKYEEETHILGTERIFKKVAESKGWKVAGGGDTQKAIMTLSIVEGFDWISIGGGAFLDFITKKTLPGIKALQK